MSRKKSYEGTDILQLYRVPMPLIEHYNDEGEIIPNDPLTRFNTPFLRITPRLPAPGVIVDWKSIHDMEEVDR